VLLPAGQREPRAAQQSNFSHLRCRSKGRLGQAVEVANAWRVHDPGISGLMLLRELE